MAKPWKPKSQRRFVRFFLPLKRFRAEDGIVIFSEARGGSTWLMQLLGKLPKTIINWEPFHPDRGVLPSAHKWGHVLYVPPEEKDPGLFRLLQDIFTLRTHSLWTLNYAERIVFTRTIITKFVRANALVPWILNNFSFNRKPIYLLRHPIATCKSKLRAFGEDKLSADGKTPTGWINTPAYDKHLAYYHSVESDLERKIILWCIHNIATLNSPAVQQNCLWVFYEDLVTDPKQELKRILSNLDLLSSERFLATLKFRKRSMSDFKRDYLTDPSAQLEKTFDGLDERTLTNVQVIFDYFDFKLYNSRGILPVKETYPHLQSK